MSRRDADQRIDELTALMGLAQREGERVEKFSTGMRQKVSMARALLHDPDVLFLDEPTLGLDPPFTRFIRHFLKTEINQKQGKTIFLTTHDMREAEYLCDRVAIVHQGRLIALDSPKNLKAMLASSRSTTLLYEGEVAAEILVKLPGVKRVSIQKINGLTKATIQANVEKDFLHTVIGALHQRVKIQSVVENEPSLEDVFLHLTGDSLSDSRSE